MLFSKQKRKLFQIDRKKAVHPRQQKESPVKAPPVKTALDELHALIGLAEVKRIVEQVNDYTKMQLLCEERGIPHKPLSLHMMFTGNPGTAKTTVARLTAKILKESGFLSKGKLIEVGRSDLVGMYQGWTAKQIKDKFNEAEGSVLFIDEAYSLVDDRSGTFGDEAINTIVQEMENRRGNMVVIFAGYRRPMEHFLACNEGLNSRITFRVNFPDYSEDELMQIFRKIVRENGREVSVEVCQAVREIIREGMKRPNFGNGRYVRKLVEQALLSQASRLMSKSEDEISNHELRFLNVEDFGEFRTREESCSAPGMAIGFAG